MASSGNQHYANCIGTLSFPIGPNVSLVLYRPTFDMTLTSKVMYFAFALSLGLYPIHTAQPDATKLFLCVWRCVLPKPITVVCPCYCIPVFKH